MIPTTLSREAYENYIYQLREYHPSVRFSTLVIAHQEFMQPTWPDWLDLVKTSFYASMKISTF